MSAEDARRMLAEYANELASLDEISAQLAHDEGGEAPSGSKTDLLLVKLIHEMKQLRIDLTSNKVSYDSELAKLKDENTQLRAITYQHQRFLEQIDSQNRVCNVVIMAVPENPKDFDGENDEEAKIKKLFLKIESQDTEIIEFKRLGEKKDRQIRPILLKTRSREARDKLLEKAKSLSSKEDPYKSVYIKKDVHPLVRLEWKRLKDREKEENEKPENVGRPAVLDSKTRTLLRDGQIIDRWQPNFF